MSDDVDPSKGADGVAFAVAQAIQQHGAVGDGWIVPTNESYATDDTATKTASGTLGAFAKVGESGLDVTFDTGEFFIGGSWGARDTQTTVSLADNTTDQTIELGWDADAGETVLIGERGTTVGDSFAARDPSIPLYTFDTDGGAVVGQTDERTVGKETQLGAATLDAGSELARFLMTAAGSTQGTPGNSTNELWRAGSSASDLLMSVNADGRMALAWNAYYDGSNWVYVVGSEPAYRLSFAGGTVELHAAAAGTAGNTISWETLGVDNGGSVSINTATLWDGSAVPQGNLGGPPSSLSSYPLPAGDIDDGSGSGLDADTVDGKEASELASGRWTQIATHTDSDSSTVVDHTFSPATVYDQYLVDIYWESNHQSSDNEFLQAQVNGQATSNYSVDIANRDTEITTDGNNSKWKYLAHIRNNRYGAGRYVITGVKDTNWLDSSVLSEAYPTISPVERGTTGGLNHVLGGVFNEHHTSVTDVRIFSGVSGSDLLGTAELTLYGRDVR